MATAMARAEQLCTDLGLEELTELNALMISQPENAWKAYMAIVRAAPKACRSYPTDVRVGRDAHRWSASLARTQ
jgi:hypothetical protein